MRWLVHSTVLCMLYMFMFHAILESDHITNNLFLSESLKHENENDEKIVISLTLALVFFSVYLFLYFCIAINTWFERISMMAIILNCITLGMYHPCGDEVCDTTRCRILELFDDFIFIFFAVEMLIKMIAMGVRGTRGAYLSETWNRLDAFIVIAG